jgi:chromate transporter
VTFVGFIGGWNAAPPGADTPFQAGLAGALTATWFTFLPSFIFIFLGAPAVESTRHLPHVNAPLAAITAAIAGVIANLAVFFARHVFWPGGVTGPPDPYPALLALAAIVAMLRLRASIIPLIGAAAALGIAMRVTGVAA